ncbi:MAG: type II toxin-antitoxin system PemK/MazF family toxin [Leptospirales bacterium]
MGVCKIWDIVKVPFPYTKRPGQQFRPALVIADIPGTSAPDFLWVLMITSAENRSWPGDIPISDLGEAGLPAPSIVRTTKIATMDKKAASLIGQLTKKDRNQIIHRIRTILIPSGICLSDP